MAIDLGTSAAKVIVFSLDGRIVAITESDTPIQHPQPTWMQSHADTWWQIVCSGIRSILEHPEVEASAIRAIGICGFMHTVVPIDGTDCVLGASLLWPDQRSVLEAAELAKYTETFIQITGNPPTTMSCVPRLRWLAKHEPDTLKRAKWLLPPKDFLRFRLTGEIATDERDAKGTGLTNLLTKEWSVELLELAGVSLINMPPIRSYQEIAGTVTSVAAAETGLQQGTPVIIGSADWFSTIIGSGCYLPERACLYLGTGGICGAFTSAKEQARLGKTVYFGGVTATGAALRWIRQLFNTGQEKTTYQAITQEAAMSEPGAKGVFFLPHLMGECGNAVRPAARGTFYGLTLAHQRSDIYRAVIEGATLWLRMATETSIKQQAIGEFLLLGGGTHSLLWRQIVAAVYNCNVLIPEIVHGGAFGMAMIAAVSTKLRSDYLSLTQEWIRIAHIEQPKPELVENYDAIYRKYKAVEAILQQLEELRV